MAKVFGVLLVVAGVGYIADGFIAVLVAGHSFSIGQLTFVGEVALIGWLLLVGRRKSFTSSEPDQSSPLDQTGPPDQPGSPGPAALAPASVGKAP